MRTVYFDYNATTPLDPHVREAMMPFLTSNWGNPSSVHHLGRSARAALDEARDRTARVLGCKPSELVFTSGGTESANMAIFGAARRLKAKGQHIVVSTIEHHAVLHACESLAQKEGFRISYLPVDNEGLVSVNSLQQAIRPDTILVSIMAANNEIGTIQPIAEIGNVCRQRGIVFHTDAVQWLGKLPFKSIYQFNADLVSICGHKIYGPKGVGALFIKSPLHLESLLVGGSHENERRAGTENLAGIAGLTEALERFVPEPVFDASRLASLSTRLIHLIDGMEEVRLVGAREKRLPNTVSFVVRGTDSIALLAGLDMEGVCASSGSACSAGSLEPSHVIRALGVEQAFAHSLVRFSLGRESAHEEVEYVENVLPKVIERARKGEALGRP
jgi:cysteine desulfurase